ncbi:DNA-directed RNA polymerase subunit D [Methanopyrus sp.]
MRVRLYDYRKTDVERATFIIEDTSAEFVNTIRRALYTLVPTLRIEEVIIYENDTPMYDEMLAHRLGLIPLRVDDIDQFELPDLCDCGGKGCEKCQVRAELEVEGPAKVYARDLEFDHPDVKPAFPDMLITQVGEDQRIRLEAIAVPGLGLEHAKWKPVSAVGYKGLPELEIDEDKLKEKKITYECPQGIIKIEDGEVVHIDEDRLPECRMYKEYERETDGAVRVRLRDDAFVFNVETDGSMPLDTAILKALDAIEHKLESLRKNLRKEVSGE